MSNKQIKEKTGSKIRGNAEPHERNISAFFASGKIVYSRILNSSLLHYPSYLKNIFIKDLLKDFFFTITLVFQFLIHSPFIQSLKSLNPFEKQMVRTNRIDLYINSCCCCCCCF
jgi:hypothetical protein